MPIIPFQSTPLTRGETFGRSAGRLGVGFQSTPLTRGETMYTPARPRGNVISIHSPHTRGDPVEESLLFCTEISIHSPHTRGDTFSLSASFCERYFNPLPSHEGRQTQGGRKGVDLIFQSTPLTRGETCIHSDAGQVQRISIHSPHTRGDALNAPRQIFADTFQSTPLTRGETAQHTFVMRP